MVIHKSELLQFSHKNMHARVTTMGLICGVLWSSKVKFTLHISSTDKFKGGKSELTQSKSGIDLNELMDLLKTRRSEWYEVEF